MQFYFSMVTPGNHRIISIFINYHRSFKNKKYPAANQFSDITAFNIA